MIQLSANESSGEIGFTLLIRSSFIRRLLLLPLLPALINVLWSYDVGHGSSCRRSWVWGQKPDAGEDRAERWEGSGSLRTPLNHCNSLGAAKFQTLCCSNWSIWTSPGRETFRKFCHLQIANTWLWHLPLLCFTSFPDSPLLLKDSLGLSLRFQNDCYSSKCHILAQRHPKDGRMCMWKKRGGGENLSLVEQGGESFPEPLSRLSLLPRWPGLDPKLTPRLRQRETGLPWPADTNPNSFLGLPCCSLPSAPLPPHTHTISSISKDEGEWSNQHSLFVVLVVLSGYLVSLFVIWTKEQLGPRRVPRIPEPLRFMA